MLVGGCVRDAVLGLPLRDLDIEVFGLGPPRLREVLSGAFRLELVGRAFPVMKVHGLPFDITLPCHRSATEQSPWRVEDFADPGMSLNDAASRRDFTMNAMALEPESGEVFDPFHGVQDLGATSGCRPNPSASATHTLPSASTNIP